MTGAPPGGGAASGYLEFFVLEAGEYIEQLDRLLSQAASTGTPEAGAVQRMARALRGTATMAKLPAFAAVASGLERVGRALQQGTLRWDPALSGALVAAIDDLKILTRAARAWSPLDEQRAAARTAELARFAPVIQTTPAANESAATPGSYLSSEASNVAAGLELLAARSGDADTAANVLRRVRALRGIAGVKEVAPLADALEATEDAARGLELGEELSAEGRQLLEASGAYLRTLARAMRGEGEGDINAPSSARDAFQAALENWSNRAAQTAQVVPIGLLFYEDTSGLVEPSPNPPTSSSERFRIELVSLGEHLRQVVAAARTAHDTGTSGRVRRDLKRAVRDAQSTAQSFGETDIAAFIETHVDSADHLDFLGLSALDDLATSLADAGAGGARLRARAQELAERGDLATSIATGLGGEVPAAEATTPSPALTPRAWSPLAIATPVYTPSISAIDQPLAAAARTPVPPTPALAESVTANAPAHVPSPAAAVPTHALDSQSANLIESSIAALEALNERPFFEPTPLPEDMLVPIDTLMYRGRAALDRAIELRDEIRKKEGGPSREVLNELFDLLELARAE
jgi:chemotaxis protein histidine kinase CheA